MAGGKLRREWLLAIFSVATALVALGAAPPAAQAQALFPGGCPNHYSENISYTFAAGSSGTFTDSGGTTCRGIQQPGNWRYRYTYTVTSTLQNASFTINSPHESGITISAPGVYEVFTSFPGTEGDYAAISSYGSSTATPIDSETAETLHTPALGLSYSTTATGPNPSGTVSVTIAHGTVDVPGSRIAFQPSPYGENHTNTYVSGSGVLRFGTSPVRAAAGQTYNLLVPFITQTGQTYTFAPGPHPSGSVSNVSCNIGTATLDTATNRITVTGQADRAQVVCTVSFAQQPAITGISPGTGPAAGGTVVTITGTNFTGVTDVRFGGVSATSFTINSATQIIATAPAGTGTVGVSARVNALANTDTAADDFTYVGAPLPPPPPPPPPPTAGSISAEVAFNSAGQAIGLDVGGDVTGVEVASGPANGTASISGTTLTYRPNTGFFGADSLTYVATGPGGSSSPATVSITVAAPPPPVVTPPPPVVQPPGSPNDPFSLVLGDTGSGVITGFRVTGAPSNGDATIEEEPIAADPAKDGAQAAPGRRFRLVYRPRATFMGEDRVTLVGFGPGGTSEPATFVFRVTGKAPDLEGRLASNATLRLSPTAGLTGGPFNAIRVTQAPAFGAVSVQGLNLVFTPALTDSGAVTIGYVIDLPFGTSAPGVARVVTDLAPIPAALTAQTEAGRPVTLELTTGARGGPFIGAAVVSVTPSTAGTAVVTPGGTATARTFGMTFTSAGRYTGPVEVGFSLTNAAATGQGTATITVAPRPDPTLDPEVRGTLDAQFDAARRLSETQIDNFTRRLEGVRDGVNASQSNVGVNLGFARSNPGTRRSGGLFGQEPVDEAERERAFLNRVVIGDGPGARPELARADRRDTAPPQGGAGDAGPGPIGVWASGTVDWGRRDATTGRRDFRITTTGLSAGLDVKLSDHLIVGGGVGWGEDRTEVGSGESRSEAEALTLAAYGSWRPRRGLFLDGALGRTTLDLQMRRQVTTTGALGVGQRDATVDWASLGAGIEHRTGRRDLHAYGRLQTQSFDFDAFVETGAGPQALRYEAEGFDRTSAILGLRASWRIQMGRSVLTPGGRIEWRHAFDGDVVQGVRYADWADSPLYLLNVDAVAAESAVVEATVGWRSEDGLRLDLGYRLQAASRFTLHGLEIRASTRF
ncbi:autotransporter family protein [Brevundimonas bacteroides]|uniref:autotransporter family protein n=1 Tax=Brevundimonas bacteroides TaxID=74311 RepID=UPI000496380B|nr:autotransporter domain-containing protein [Brevundimonas bacteroides]